MARTRNADAAEAAGNTPVAVVGQHEPAPSDGKADGSVDLDFSEDDVAAEDDTGKENELGSSHHEAATGGRRGGGSTGQQKKRKVLLAAAYALLAALLQLDRQHASCTSSLA